MSKTAKTLVSVLLVMSMFAALLPVGLFMSAATADGTQSQDSVVVIDDSLKTEESLAIFNQSFGGTPALKEIDGEIVGVTMTNVGSIGYPYMLFGETEWEDYILEFTSHDLVRVAGIVRSSGATSGNDSYGGLAALYETTYLSAAYSAYENSKYSTKGLSTPAETGSATGAAFTYRGDMRFVIKVEGNRMTTTVSYTDENGNAQSYTTDVDTTASGKTYGKPGLRTVYNLLNGTKANGYFSDLKVTLIGDTAKQYYKEQNTESIVAIDDSLKTEESLDLFTKSFGGTPALKTVDGEVVGVTFANATGSIGYPYMLFGDASWEDYILEFTTHDLVRVAGIVRSTGAVSGNDSYGGLMAAYETTNLTTKYASKSSSGSYSSITLNRGNPTVATFTQAGDMRFVIKVVGNKMTTTVSYTDANGNPQSYTTSVLTEESGKIRGQLGFRTVYNLVNGAKANGYFSDLKVTLLGDTATQYMKENSTVSHVVIDDSLKTEESLALFTQSFGGTPALKEIDGEVVGVTLANATGSIGYPYMLFGDAEWEDYILEFTSHDLVRVAGIVRATGAVANNDGYGGIMAAYETTTLSTMYSSKNGNAYSSVSLKNGTSATASFTQTGDIRFVIKVVGNRMITTASYTDAEGKMVSHTIDANVADTSKTNGQMGFRTVYNLVNGAKANGYFSDLKVTLLGETAEKYLAENPVERHVVIDDSLKTEQSLDIFTTVYGGTPALKVVDGEAVGVTINGADGTLGYPYMTFGESDWEDYILEFTTHDLWRVSGIVRSDGGAWGNDSYGGLATLYETTYLSNVYSSYDAETKKYSTVGIKDGDITGAAFTFTGEMRFVIKVIGNKMISTVSYKDASGKTVTHKLDIDTTVSGKTAGKLGLRAVFNQLNGAKSNGYFSDLKVTLLGDTATKYLAENPDAKHVVIDDALTTGKALDMFDAFGGTPALKIVDGEAVGLTMSNVDPVFGYPYMLFGDADWEDYILEFTTHDMYRVGGIVRALGEVAHLDGYGGLLGAYETNSLTAKNSVYDKDAENYFTSVTLKDGAHPSAAFTYNGEMRFVIKVVGDTMKVTVSFKTAAGEPRSYSIDVNVAETGKNAGRLGLRPVFNQINGDVAEGYFSDLKVTLLGETAQNYIDSLPKFAGDLDSDGALTNADVALLVRYLSGWKLDFGTSEWADMDGNDIVNNRDAIMLIQTMAGWIENGNIELDLSSSMFSTSYSYAAVTPNSVNTVDPLIFGDNISWRFDGFGLWDAETNSPNPELLEALRASGITSLRYTGGIEGDYFHWQESIGDDRIEQIDPFRSPNSDELYTAYPYFGLNEFFEVCELLDIPAVIQLNAGTGTPEEAAALVKYCVDNNYNVSSFCVGNEVHLAEEKIDGMPVTKTSYEYILFYLETYRLLGDYADRVELGCIGLTSEHLLSYRPNWNKNVLSALNGKIDFVDAHLAYSPYTAEQNTNEEIIRCYLASAAYIDQCIKAQLKDIDTYSPGASLQITEYGTLGKYSNSMAGAAYLASLLGVMTEEERISSANHFSALLIYESSPTLVGYKKDENGNVCVFDNAMSPIFRWYSEQGGRSVLDTRVSASTFTSAECGLMPEITDAPTLYCNTYYDETTGEGSIIIVNTNPEKNEQTDITLPFGIQITDISEVYSTDPLARNTAASSPVTERHYASDETEVSSGMLRITTKPISVVRIDFVRVEENMDRSIDVYIIAGQSNASGYTGCSEILLEDLWADSRSGTPNVLYTGRAEYTVNVNTPQVATGVNEFETWVPARAGMGKSSDHMGAEVGMASYLSEKYYNNGKTAGIIKFAHGGTSLFSYTGAENAASGNWVSPSYAQALGVEWTGLTGGLYRGLLEQIERSVAQLEGLGYTEVNIKGVFWMQGESDSHNPTEYKRAFGYLASDLRSDIGEITGTDASDLPIIVGEISRTSGSAKPATVEKNERFIAMQRQLAQEMDNVYVIASGQYEINALDADGNDRTDRDPWHWNTAHMFAIGRLVGECIVEDILAD